MRRAADALEAKGMRIVDFGVGEPDFDVPPPVRDAAIRAIRDDRPLHEPGAGAGEVAR